MYSRGFRGLRPVFALAALSLVASDPAAANRRTLCVHGIQPPGVLRVYGGPGEGAPVLGSFPARACDVRLTGRCQAHWCQMSLGKTSGWVDTRKIGVYEVPEGAGAAADGPSAAGSFAAPATAATPDQAPQPLRAASVVMDNRPVVIQPGTRPRAATARNASGRAAARRRVAERAAPRRSWAPPALIRYFGFVAPGPAVPGPARSCVVDVASWDTLRVRSGPGVQHGTIGEIPPRACGVVGLGGCYGSWCRVAWRGQHGWVNTRYLE